MEQESDIEELRREEALALPADIPYQEYTDAQFLIPPLYTYCSFQ